MGQSKTSMSSRGIQDSEINLGASTQRTVLNYDDNLIKKSKEGGSSTSIPSHSAYM